MAKSKFFDHLKKGLEESIEISKMGLDKAKKSGIRITKIKDPVKKTTRVTAVIRKVSKPKFRPINDKNDDFLVDI